MEGGEQCPWVVVWESRDGTDRLEWHTSRKNANRKIDELIHFGSGTEISLVSATLL